MQGPSFFQRVWKEFSDPVLAALRHGLSPGKAALAVALGAWLGLIPTIVGTMLLCLLAAWLLRLNHVVIQTANYAVFPLQLLLVLPFWKLGDWAFDGPGLPIQPAHLMAQLRVDPWALIQSFGWIGLHAVAAWAALGLLAVPLLWWALRAVFRRIARDRHPAV